MMGRDGGFLPPYRPGAVVCRMQMALKKGDQVIPATYRDSWQCWPSEWKPGRDGRNWTVRHGG